MARLSDASRQASYTPHRALTWRTVRDCGRRAAGQGERDLRKSDVLPHKWLTLPRSAPSVRLSHVENELEC
eukprot:5113183-Prymnesium_polylepis.1